MADATDTLSKLPPQNLEAEASILGGVLLDNEAINNVIELVNPDDLYRESHRKIFRAMVALWDRNEPVDLITLSDQLKSMGELEAAGGSAYLAELASQVPTAANIAYYARIVREKAILRHLIRTSTDIATRGLEERGDVDMFLDDAERAIFDISEKRINAAFVRIGDVMTDTIKRVDELYHRKELVTGVGTGYADLDRLTAGFQPSDLLIVAGRPGMGKTAFALNIAVNAALKGVGVAIFSREMAMEELVVGVLCAA
ncbi:MAG: replicative DNA helicase, partial [Deltaproteobacteria bacterium]|nr:replicative DNA helicase [Deltaproteobacteria bacterium]